MPDAGDVPVLHTLAQQGDLAEIRKLLDTASGGDATERDHEGITALHWAAMGMHVEACRLLLERGAEVDAVGGELMATPLHWAARYVRAPGLSQSASHAQYPRSKLLIPGMSC